MPASVPDPESLDARRRRAIYRAWHRGTRELDLVLGPFADRHARAWNAEALELFETLMRQEEIHLQRILMGQDSVPEGELGSLMGKIRAYRLATAGQGNGR